MLRGAADLQKSKIAQDLDVVLLQAQRILVALDGLVVVAVRAIQQPAATSHSML